MSLGYQQTCRNAEMEKNEAKKVDEVKIEFVPKFGKASIWLW